MAGAIFLQKNSHLTRGELELTEILKRGHQRREVINKSLGSNTQHRHTYFMEKHLIEPPEIVENLEERSLSGGGNDEEEVRNDENEKEVDEGQQ